MFFTYCKVDHIHILKEVFERKSKKELQENIAKKELLMNFLIHRKSKKYYRKLQLRYFSMCILYMYIHIIIIYHIKNYCILGSKLM